MNGCNMLIVRVKNKIIEKLKTIEMLKRFLMDRENKSFIRGLTEFALNYDVESETETQKRLLEENPNNTRAHFNLGVLYYFHGKVEAAIDSYTKALEIDPNLSEAHKNLGEIYAVREQYDLAWKHAKSAEMLGNTKLIEMLRRYLKEPLT
ncbi:MAG: tetratricopeptide repeat protein [Candidatus Dadabacteria bacterium]|nr:tetratricopeptide repeat protein [Candidatus Dadabacteria bacterium]